VRLYIPYGDRELPFDLPDGSSVRVVTPGCDPSEELQPPRGSSAADEREEIRRALREPIGSPRLADLAQKASSAIIVVSDITRPCPSYRFLPALLEELRPVAPEAITIVFALGGTGRTRSKSSGS